MKSSKVLSALSIFVICLMSLFVLAACGDTEETTVAETTTTAAPTTAAPTTTAAATEAAVDEDNRPLPPEGYMYSYLTGELIETSKGTLRPLGVQIDNERYALPQCGISSADIIYEVPIEADEVRLTAIFQDISDLERVGPIRSARSYHPGILAEYDGIFIHNGHSKYALSILKDENCDDIELVDVDNSYEFKSSDHRNGHNDFTNSKLMEKRIAYYEFERTISSDFTYKFKFTTEAAPTLLENGSSAVKVTTGYTQNKSYFEYNAEEGVYYRFDKRFSDNKHIDGDTGEQLTCKNIIIQYCTYDIESDGKNKDIHTVGTGTGAFVTNGKVVNITWSKASYWDNTHYYYEDGTEIVLNQGKTWVCIVLPSLTGESKFE